MPLKAPGRYIVNGKIWDSANRGKIQNILFILVLVLAEKTEEFLMEQMNTGWFGEIKMEIPDFMGMIFT